MDSIKCLLFSAILFFSFSLALRGQWYNYHQYHEDKSAAKVNCVIQDDLGFIWLGKENGLFQFDGYTFQNRSEQLISVNIKKMKIFNNDLYFINDIGLFKLTLPLLNGVEELTKIYPFQSINEENRAYLDDFDISSSGKIWIIFEDNRIISIEEDRESHYTLNNITQKGTPNIYIDERNRMWVSKTDAGIFLFNPSTDEFDLVLPHSDIRSVFIEKGFLLIGNDDLEVYEIKNDKIEKLREVDFGIDSHITSMTNKKDEYIILGFSDGSIREISIEGQISAVYGSQDPNRLEDLEMDHIYQIYMNRDTSVNTDGDIWVCSENGLWLLKEYFFNTLRGTDLHNIRSMAIDKQNEIFACNGHLFKLESRFGNVNAQEQNKLADFIQFHNKELWTLYQSSNANYTNYTLKNLTKQQKLTVDLDGKVQNFYTDFEGNHWLCQEPVNKPVYGIYKLDTNNRLIKYDHSKGVGARINDIEQNQQGEVYIVGSGTHSFLFKYNESMDTFINLSDLYQSPNVDYLEAHDVSISDHGIVWLATNDGVLEYDGEKITRIIHADAVGLQILNDNILWISTATNGLIYYDNGEIIPLKEESGLPSRINHERGLWLEKNGSLWVTTNEGLAYSKIKNYTLPTSRSPQIISLSVNKKSIKLDTHRVVKFNQGNDLEIEFNNLSYPVDNAVYEYRLFKNNEIEVLKNQKPWNVVKDHNKIKLNHLDEGKYLLELRCEELNGHEWSSSTKMNIHVVSPWYLRIEFFVLSGTLLLVFAGEGMRTFLRNEIKKIKDILIYANKRLAEKEAELNQKIIDYNLQKETLKDTHTKLNALDKFADQLTQHASWNDLIFSLGHAINNSKDIEAIELSILCENELVCRGYSNLEKGGYTHSSIPFDPLNNLPSWCINNKDSIIINNYESEHEIYIKKQKSNIYQSVIIVPFMTDVRQNATLNVYSTKDNQYDNNDRIIVKIITDLIMRSVKVKFINTDI